MKAAVLFEANKLDVIHVDVPKAAQGELVMRVKSAAICGTDSRIITGRKTKGVRFPSVIGHEFAGEVVEVGQDVTRFSISDRIAVDPVIPCRSCLYCRSGKENVCQHRQAIGYEFDGAFAEYVKIPAIALEAGNVFKLPDSVSYDAAALAEPLACCINGQKNVGIHLGDVVVILGAGPIGLMHVALAKRSGASKIIVSDLNENRRSVALQCGASHAVDASQQDLKAIVMSETSGLGADVAIMAIGLPALVNPSLELLRKGGRANLFAGFSKEDTADVDVNLIHYNELVITGASALSREGYEKALGLISSGQINVEALITHRFSLSEINEALRYAQKGDAVKVIIHND
ncbi:zinc-dependent dehydrogenase [uncultured Pantoea sp.]|uniref:zinc-dependent dehydrogenase n=1 Tax=uncultured Pantoea sp. TaxID=218084 RepID=UPI00258D32DB|nr:zinc-dependent dehydrogenase [uncultured Pantoea sp.]